MSEAFFGAGFQHHLAFGPESCNLAFGRGLYVGAYVIELFLRLTILDVYRGERYDDTCISELYATAEMD